jgi:hypothetical protein
VPYVADAPVYFALSGSVPIAREQMKAARRVAETGKRVLFRDHPMYPVEVEEASNLQRASTGMLDQPALSAVVYSTGTSGLEAMLAGLPTIRFRPDDRVAVDVLPAGTGVPGATCATIVDILKNVGRPTPVDWEKIFAPVDYAIWHSELLDSTNQKANCLA